VGRNTHNPYPARKGTTKEAKVNTAQIGIADSADFENGTWTFSMGADFRVTAGRYAILPEREYLALVDMANKASIKHTAGG